MLQQGCIRNVRCFQLRPILERAISRGSLYAALLKQFLKLFRFYKYNIISMKDFFDFEIFEALSELISLKEKLLEKEDLLLDFFGSGENLILLPGGIDEMNLTDVESKDLS